ncbi:MAG: hypothetical protein B0W54_01380 [Cellvibrio sp. 79]|nr:MAG: hypothetical protein B0W54_01380 [Cellvibrio sp. 79]
MCNASNHPLGCTCGFGESGGIKFRSKAQIVFPFNTDQRISHSNIVSHAPNATCPVCKEPVFFYKNEHGSAVFFDELGPPWPKHPCTDSKVLVPFTMKQGKPKKSSAKAQGWFAVELINASRIKGNTYEFQCKLENGSVIKLFVPSEEVEQKANLKILSEDAICFLRENGDGFYSISLLSDDLKILNSGGKTSNYYKKL